MQAARALAFVTGSLYFAAVYTKLTPKMGRNFCFAILGALVLQLAFMVYDMFGQPNFWMTVGYLSLMITVTGLYILIDLLYIITPGAMNLDDYILGALMLYLDLIQMFLYILEAMGN